MPCVVPTPPLFVSVALPLLAFVVAVVAVLVVSSVAAPFENFVVIVVVSVLLLEIDAAAAVVAAADALPLPVVVASVEHDIVVDMPSLDPID